ncbi:hypothetical protein AURDEDRAFT_162604 [Auricularia subglabra TFB-10046 SS5]|nr:hypothetical protein AURDEDRAFT_162604 [Auricularia subglabra TFB-10046 SS5]
MELTNAFYRVEMGPPLYRNRWGQQVLNKGRVVNGVRYFTLYFASGATQEFPLHYLKYDLSGTITAPT